MKEKDISRRFQKSIIAYSILGTLAIGVIVAVVCIVPLYHYLEKEVERNLSAILRVRVMAIEDRVARAKTIALQISARTSLRQKLEAFNQGAIELAELVRFSTKRLAENLRYSEEIAGISSLDGTNQLVIQLGIPIPEAVRVIPPADSMEVFVRAPVQLPTGSYMVIGAPLLDDGFHRVGTDVILFKLSFLQNIVRDKSGLGKTGETILARAETRGVHLLYPVRGDPEPGEALLPGKSPLAALLEQALNGRSGIAVLSGRALTGTEALRGPPEVVAFGPVPHTALAIAIKIDKNEAYAQVTHQILLVAGVILGLVLIGTLGMFFLLRPVTGKIIMHSDELQKEIEKRTEALEVELQERKGKEEQLVRLSTAIEHAGESVIITDLEGIITYVNPAFEAITGFAREESLGQPFKMLLGQEQEDQASFDQIIESLARSGLWKGRITSRRKNRTLFSVDFAISPVRSPAGPITHYVAVGHDVSQVVRLEQQLLQAQKMEAIGTLAAGIAHDFNNILMPILINAGMVAKNLTEDDANRMRLNRVIRASHRAKGLIKQILDFSRKENEEQRPLQVTPLIKETLKLMQALLPSNIEIRQVFTATSDFILANPSQFHQVLMNLFTNATQAMEAFGGVLAVTLEDITPDEAFPVRQLGSGNYLRLVVSDSGQGIPGEILDRIFEPYFTTKKAGEGTGLGLAVTHGIVQRLGGRITVQSELGKGSRFEILLPKAVVTAPPEIEPPDVPTKGKASILIVDDEEEILTTLSDLLGGLGYQVTAKQNGIGALKTFRARPDAFDLVLTDQIMPNMSGNALIESLLAIRNDLPIILCSGYSDIPADLGEKHPAIFRRVSKPIDAREITEVISQVLDDRRTMDATSSREKIHA